MRTAIPEIDRYDALREAILFSVRINGRLKEALESSQLPLEVLTVAVAGSLGRLESSSLSDIDYIIVLTKEVEDRKVSHLIDQVNAAVVTVGLQPPDADSRLARPRTLSELLDGMGSANEDPDLLRKRLLLLLESRSVWNEMGFEECLARILSRYALGVTQTPEDDSSYLLNDLIRYYRNILVRADHSWPERDIKAEHSRVIMYAGLLALLGDGSKQGPDNRLEWLRNKLAMTPLERLADVYTANQDPNLPHLLSTYNLFLERWSNREVRGQLSRLDDDARSTDPVHSEFALTSQLLKRELTRFALARRNDWTEAFFSRLLF